MPEWSPLRPSRTANTWAVTGRHASCGLTVCRGGERQPLMDSGTGFSKGPRDAAGSGRLRGVSTTNLRHRLEQRWDRRQDAWRAGLEQFTVQATVQIAKPAQEVWDLVTSPHADVLLGDHRVRSFAVPGTPEELGHQYCSLRREDSGRMTATVSEIVECQPPHRFVAKTLTGTRESLKTVVVNPTPTGCTYTVSIDMRISHGTSRTVAPAAQRAIEAATAKVRSIVESGVCLETVSQARETNGQVGASEAALTADEVARPGTTGPVVFSESTESSSDEQLVATVSGGAHPSGPSGVEVHHLPSHVWRGLTLVRSMVEIVSTGKAADACSAASLARMSVAVFSGNWLPGRGQQP